MSQNSKTNKPWTRLDLKRHKPSQKLVNHETHTVFLVCEVNQGVILFSCKFCEISKNTFFTEHTRATASVKIKCKLKLWLQSKRIYTSFPWPLRRLSYEPPHLKQHHCNNSCEFKILQQMSSEYLLSTSAYQNWLLICKTGNKWHMCKSIYI